jgi:hypothetical protein
MANSVRKCSSQDGKAVRRCAVLVVAELQRPQPRHSYRRRIGFEDTADNGTIGQHVVIILIPMPRSSYLLRLGLVRPA